MKTYFPPSPLAPSPKRYYDPCEVMAQWQRDLLAPRPTAPPAALEVELNEAFDVLIEAASREAGGDFIAPASEGGVASQGGRLSIDVAVMNIARGDRWFLGPRCRWPVRQWRVAGHHVAHASLAFYDSPFRTAVVFVMDGGGNSVVTTPERRQQQERPAVDGTRCSPGTIVVPSAAGGEAWRHGNNATRLWFQALPAWAYLGHTAEDGTTTMRTLRVSAHSCGNYERFCRHIKALRKYDSGLGCAGKARDPVHSVSRSVLPRPCLPTNTPIRPPSCPSFLYRLIWFHPSHTFLR